MSLYFNLFFPRQINISFIGYSARLASGLPEADLDALAAKIHHSQYIKFCQLLGEKHNSAANIRVSNLGNVEMAMRDVLQKWFDRTPAKKRRQVLKTAMYNANLMGIFKDVFHAT